MAWIGKKHRVVINRTSGKLCPSILDDSDPAGQVRKVL